MFQYFELMISEASAKYLRQNSFDTILSAGKLHLANQCLVQLLLFIIRYSQKALIKKGKYG
jgi:hypothetical protein